jgi:hypothetical protein
MYRDPKKNWDRKALHADHSKSRSRHGKTNNAANRLMHDTCNKQRGNGARDHLRPALQHHGNGDHDPAGLGDLALEWPTP